MLGTDLHGVQIQSLHAICLRLSYADMTHASTTRIRAIRFEDAVETDCHEEETQQWRRAVDRDPVQQPRGVPGRGSRAARQEDVPPNGRAMIAEAASAFPTDTFSTDH